MFAIGGDDIVRALEQHLRKQVPIARDRLGYGDSVDRTDLGDIQTWQIVPTAEAISAAKLPAVAIVSPRMGATPERSGNTYSGVWQASVGIYTRGKDHEDTQTRVAAWAKVIRTAAVMVPMTATGLSLRWAGEEYDLVPTKQDSRTIAGAEVMFDVIVDVALDLNGSTTLPPLLSVHHDIIPTN